MTKTFPAPEPPFTRARWHGDPQDPTGGIIRLHSTVSPCAAGEAKNVAHFFATEDNKTSAHYCVDSSPVYARSVVQCVGDHYTSWDCGWNPPGISVEMCEYPSTNIARWDDAAHRQLERNAVRLVAELCLAYRIRPYFVGRFQLRLGIKGVTTHAEVSKAFPNLTDHTDPGAWRRWRFMHAVRREIRAIKRGH